MWVFKIAYYMGYYTICQDTAATELSLLQQLQRLGARFCSLQLHEAASSLGFIGVRMVWGLGL